VPVRKKISVIWQYHTLSFTNAICNFYAVGVYILDICCIRNQLAWLCISVFLSFATFIRVNNWRNMLSGSPPWTVTSLIWLPHYYGQLYIELIRRTLDILRSQSIQPFLILPRLYDQSNQLWSAFQICTIISWVTNYSLILARNISRNL